MNKSIAEPFHEKTRKQKRSVSREHPMNMRKRWTINIAMALVFGLVAGSVTYGVNYAGNKLNGDGTAPAIQNTVVASGNKNNSDGVTTASSTNSDSVYSVSEVAKNAMPSMVAISTETVETVQSFFGTYSQTVPASGSGVMVWVRMRMSF